MARLMKTSRPVWCDENEDVETAAVILVDGAEYRETDGHDSPDGANSPDRSMGLKEGPRA